MRFPASTASPPPSKTIAGCKLPEYASRQLPSATLRKLWVALWQLSLSDGLCERLHLCRACWLELMACWFSWMILLSLRILARSIRLSREGHKRGALATLFDVVCYGAAWKKDCGIASAFQKLYTLAIAQLFPILPSTQQADFVAWHRICLT